MHMINDIKTKNTKISTDKPVVYDDLARNWRAQTGMQFGIPLDVAPLTGLRLSNNYFVDKTSAHS